MTRVEKCRLDSIAKLWYKGQALKKNDLTDSGMWPCIHYGELFSKYDAIIEKVISKCDTTPKIISRNGDILFPASDVTAAGLARCSAIMQEGVIIGGDVIGMRPVRGLNSIYLSYAIRHQRQQLLQRVTGALIKHISTKSLRSVLIPIHPIEIQNRFESIVRLLTHVIECRRTQLAKLDSLIKARFVEMFGGSTFPTEQLYNNVEEMFIGPFGSSLKNESFVPQKDGYCVVYEQRHAIHKTIEKEFRYVNKEKYEELKRFLILPGDLIMSCRGTIGEIYRIPSNAPRGIMHPSIMKIRLKQSSYDPIFFLCAMSNFMGKNLDKSNGGVVKMALTAKTLGATPFIKPHMALQHSFAAFVQQVDKSKVAVQKALDKAQQLYDSLMQQYFD